MAEAILGSLDDLREAIHGSPELVSQWRRDPIACFDLMLRTIRNRHLHGMSEEQLIEAEDARRRS
jgi:hypothetical protein